jgi:hypothetical protein
MLYINQCAEILSQDWYVMGRLIDDAGLLSNITQKEMTKETKKKEECKKNKTKKNQRRKNEEQREITCRALKA